MNSSYFSSSFAPPPRIFTVIGVAGRVIDESFKLSDTRDAFVTYSIATAGLFQGTATLEISENDIDWSEIARYNEESGRVGVISGIIPKGYFMRITEVGGDVSVQSGQEVLL